jgi:hypothetical protein
MKERLWKNVWVVLYVVLMGVLAMPPQDREALPQPAFATCPHKPKSQRTPQATKPTSMIYMCLDKSCSVCML